MKRLAICIPTFRRPEMLRVLLTSIALQDRQDIQVIVSDDASNDATIDVVESMKPLFNDLKLLTQSSNAGLDANYHIAACAADAEFLWMFGDDDRLAPNGITNVLAYLDRWPTVTGLTVGVLNYDHNLQKVTEQPPMPPEQVLVGKKALFTKIPELLGFMSALVIRRDSWMKVYSEFPVRKFYNLYSQVYVIGCAVGDSGSWGISPAISVHFRSGNDQFGQRMGWGNRLEADVRGYSELGDELLGDSPAARRAMSYRILRTHVYSRVKNGKLSGLNTAEIVKAGRLLIGAYAEHPRLWTHVIPLLLLPDFIFRTMLRAYRLMRSPRVAA